MSNYIAFRIGLDAAGDVVCWACYNARTAPWDIAGHAYNYGDAPGCTCADCGALIVDPDDNPDGYPSPDDN